MGELRSWWTSADKTAWTLPAPGRAAQRLRLPGREGAKVNGTLTQGAEPGRHRRPGTGLGRHTRRSRRPPAQQQGFFRLVHVSAQQLSPNEAARRLTADIRAPGLWRNGTLANLPAFGATFSCKAGQPMQRSESEQIASGAEPAVTGMQRAPSGAFTGCSTIPG